MDIDGGHFVIIMTLCLLAMTLHIHQTDILSATDYTDLIDLTGQGMS